MRELLPFVLVLTATCAPTVSTSATSATPPEPRESASRPRPDLPPDPVGTASPGSRGCDRSEDCGAGESCFAPDFQPGRGAMPRCQSDSQCERGTVCGGYDCVPRCRADRCGPGARCASSGRCEPLPCTDPDAPPCPQNHRCDEASGLCARVACRASSQCDAGACWRGRCFARGGVCMNQSYCCPP